MCPIPLLLPSLHSLKEEEEGDIYGTIEEEDEGANDGANDGAKEEGQENNGFGTITEEDDY